MAFGYTNFTVNAADIFTGEQTTDVALYSSWYALLGALPFLKSQDHGCDKDVFQ